MAKNTARALAILGAILLLTAGCGTVDANYHITYTDGGSVQDELTVTCTGPMASYVLTPEIKDGLASSGWEVTTDVTDEATTLTAVGPSRQSGDPSSTGLTGLAGGLAVVEGGNPFVKTYTVDYTAPGQEMALPEESDVGVPLSQEDMEQMVEGVFKLSISITLPGKIVESNADSVQGDTATWYYTYKGLQSERQFQARSQRLLWANIALAVGLAGGAGVVGLALVVFCVLRLRRSTAAEIPAAAGPQAGGEAL